MTRDFTAEVHEEDGMLWAQVRELPGCFASGADLDELKAGLREAVAMYERPSTVDARPPMAAPPPSAELALHVREITFAVS